MEAQLFQTIPLTYSRISDGAEVSGLNVNVQVIDAKTGSILLNSSSMSEVVAGQYVLNWTNSLTVFTHCKAIYSESGQTYVEYFDVEDDDDTIERSSGKTV